MSEPVVLRWQMPAPIRGAGGRVAACPECGLMVRLILAMDLDDHSDEPSYLTCPGGHTWPEAAIPRRLGALLLAEILESDPGLYGRLDELREIYGNG
ncbi:hypothetical protein [Streptomyces sp. NPDC088812]|uniref:hypothetical protein n=1 Tax=Streptomyces sp. NPDC088812 TaxID=3365905 RepID=UPI00380E24A3